MKASPFGRFAVEAETSADFLESMLHIRQAVSKAVRCGDGETSSIVFNPNFELRIIQRKSDMDFGCAGVLGNVIQSFFSRKKEIMAQFGRKRLRWQPGGMSRRQRMAAALKNCS